MNGGDGSHRKLLVNTAQNLVVQAVSIVLDGDGLVPLLNSHLIDVVLLDEIEEGTVSKHLGHLELVLVPGLREACFNVALGHVELLPVNPGTEVTNKDGEGHIEVGRLVLATLDAVGVESIFCEELFQ